MPNERVLYIHTNDRASCLRMELNPQASDHVKKEEVNLVLLLLSLKAIGSACIREQSTTMDIEESCDGNIRKRITTKAFTETIWNRH